MALTKATTIKFYKRRDIQDAMIQHAKGKEVGMCFGDGYGKRPDVITYPRDILELALKGVTSFHTSEEIWENPLSLGGNLSRKDLDELREGWDLILDIDCKIMEYSRICADLVIKFLKYCGVTDISAKFSGNKGFHIGVPFESFPKNVGEKLTKDMFPEAPKKIALYITHHIEEELAKQIIAFEGNDIGKVKEKVGDDIVTYGTNDDGDNIAYLDIEKFLEIDTVLISSRHLYRMPYSLHEKSGLASLPIDPSRVLEFEKPMAHPDKILTPMFTFLNRNVEESGRNLLMQALDFEVKAQDEVEVKEYRELVIESPITQEFFPPCIKTILEGVDDGKKRAVFILMNFLGKIGWSKEEVTSYLFSWNKQNPDPLRDNYIYGQLNHFKPREKLPPNCDNEGYALGIGVCKPDGMCKKIKNPVNYTIIRWRKHKMDVKQGDVVKEKKNEKRET